MSYFVHVVRMQRERHSSVMLYGHTVGSRARGRPGQKWIDDIRDGCSDLGLTLLEATTTRLADNRRAWRSAARDASQHVVISSSSSGHHSLAGCTVTRRAYAVTSDHARYIATAVKLATNTVTHGGQKQGHSKMCHYTQDDVTSQSLWSRYDCHFVGITVTT